MSYSRKPFQEGRLAGTLLHPMVIQRKQIMPEQTNIIYPTVAFSQSRHHLAYRVAVRCPCPDNVGVSATFNGVDYMRDYVLPMKPMQPIDA